WLNPRAGLELRGGERPDLSSRRGEIRTRHFVKRISTSVPQTEAIAGELAKSLVGGEVITLEGELGAGKTQFVRGLVRGLGGDAHAVSSPTFVLLNVYDMGRLKVFHLDAYRVTGAEDFDA